MSKEIYCSCNGMPKKGNMCPYVIIGLIKCGAPIEVNCPYKETENERNHRRVKDE